jgi:hypothetical protein
MKGGLQTLLCNASVYDSQNFVLFVFFVAMLFRVPVLYKYRSRF